MAFVVAKPDAKIEPDAVRAHLLGQVEAKRISKYAVPELHRITFVSEIPKTSVGKINKKLLREEARVTAGPEIERDTWPG